MAERSALPWLANRYLGGVVRRSCKTKITMKAHHQRTAGGKVVPVTTVALILSFLDSLLHCRTRVGASGMLGLYMKHVSLKALLTLRQAGEYHGTLFQ